MASAERFKYVKGLLEAGHITGYKGSWLLTARWSLVSAWGILVQEEALKMAGQLLICKAWTGSPQGKKDGSHQALPAAPQRKGEGSRAPGPHRAC